VIQVHHVVVLKADDEASPCVAKKPKRDESRDHCAFETGFRNGRGRPIAWRDHVRDQKRNYRPQMNADERESTKMHVSASIRVSFIFCFPGAKLISALFSSLSDTEQVEQRPC
jgi:hypothetical protein